MKIKNFSLLCAVLFNSLNCLAAGYINVNFGYISTTGNVNSIRAFPGSIVNTVSCCPANVKMEIISTSVPSGWGVSICDPANCYPVGVTTSNFTLNPSANRYVGVDFHINTNAGTGTTTIRWTNLDDTTNIINVTFTMTAGATGIAFSENMDSYLDQNFPNPFSNSTTIKYRLDQPNGRIVITDMLGKNLSAYSLHNNSGEIIFDQKVRQGIYFYSLYSDDKIISRNRMIVQ